MKLGDIRITRGVLLLPALGLFLALGGCEDDKGESFIDAGRDAAAADMAAGEVARDGGSETAADTGAIDTQDAAGGDTGDAAGN